MQPSPSPQQSTPAQSIADYLADYEPRDYHLRLYVNRGSPRSLRSMQRVQQICDQYLQGRYHLEIIDIHEQPEMLQQDQIFAVPTLVRHRPLPIQRLIGDMSDREVLMAALGLVDE
jgi:circadian clock protein KaiB